jgi:hypothetical protein
VPDVPGAFLGGSGDEPERAHAGLKPAQPHYTSSMAEPATDSRAGDDAPLFDPIAVDRAYLQERARRRARIERSRAQRRASLRFWLVLLGLIAVSVLLTLTIWREVERLFGL